MIIFDGKLTWNCCNVWFVKAHIRIPRKGAKLGVADDFPKELDEVRKELQSVLKKARQERKLACFNVENSLSTAGSTTDRKRNVSRFMVN